MTCLEFEMQGFAMTASSTSIGRRWTAHHEIMRCVQWGGVSVLADHGFSTWHCETFLSIPPWSPVAIVTWEYGAMQALVLSCTSSWTWSFNETLDTSTDEPVKDQALHCNNFIVFWDAYSLHPLGFSMLRMFRMKSKHQDLGKSLVPGTISTATVSLLCILALNTLFRGRMKGDTPHVTDQGASQMVGQCHGQSIHLDREPQQANAASNKLAALRFAIFMVGQNGKRSWKSLGGLAISLPAFSLCSMPQHIPRGGKCDGSNASGGVALLFFVWVIRKNDRKCRTFVSYHLVPLLDSSISENFPFNWPSGR